MSHNCLGQEKRDLKDVNENHMLFIRPRTMNSFNLIQALMRLSFLITLVSVHMCFNYFNACKKINSVKIFIIPALVFFVKKNFFCSIL